MSKCTSYDIILQTNQNSERFDEFLRKLADTTPNANCNIIIWNKHNEKKLVEKWENIFSSIIVCNSGDLVLSELVQNDVILIDSDLNPTIKWLDSLADFAYNTPETATVSPLIKRNKDVIKIDDSKLSEIRLLDHLWCDNCGIDCLFIKREVIVALGNYKLQDLYTDDFPNELSKIVVQLGFNQEVCDSLVLYHNTMKTSGVAYGHPELFDNIKLHESLNNEKKKILYVIQADFSSDASNNIGGTQLHVKDLVFGVNDEYQVFVAARDGEFIRVTAFLDAKKYIFKFYIGKPSKLPVFYDSVQRKLFNTILNAFSIDLVHVHHTYNFSMEIYWEASRLNIPIILTLHDFYFLCPTIKMFDVNNECCIGADYKERCMQCLPKLMNVAGNLDYIAYWRSQTYKILQLCERIIVPSENAKQIFIQYFSGIADSIQVVEHGYDVIHKSIVEVSIVSEVRENIESINQTGQCTEICGWAYYDGINNNAGKIYLEITDSKGVVINVPTYKNERNDVAQGNIKNLKTGFQAFVPNCGIENENLKFRVIVTSADKYYSSGKFYELTSIVSKKSENLRVAFIGGLTVAKGSQQIYDLIQKDIEGIDWYIFGGIDDERLQKLNKINLTRTNFYQREDLSSYLNLHKIDIIVILSLWPETFCYTLSEAIAYKRPVIVTDIGALGERTKQMQCGWVVSLTQIVSDVAEILERIKTKSEEFERICKKVENISLRSLREMNQRYLELYENVRYTRIGSREYDARQLYYAWQERIVVDNQQGRVISEEEYHRYIMKLEQEINQLYASRSYKLARKISDIWFRLRGRRR